jgi:hypothetical protein
MGIGAVYDMSRARLTASEDPESGSDAIQRVVATSSLPMRTQSSSPDGARFPQGQHDWDFAIPIIRELYMVQNLPLPKVIEIMTTKHGFKATYGVLISALRSPV